MESKEKGGGSLRRLDNGVLGKGGEALGGLPNEGHHCSTPPGDCQRGEIEKPTNSLVLGKNFSKNGKKRDGSVNVGIINDVQRS